MAAHDREHLAFLDVVVPEAARGSLMATLHATREHAAQFYDLLDALADLEPGDPRVAHAAEALTALLPADLVPPVSDQKAGGLMDNIFADLAPAQRRAVRDAMRLIAERREGRTQAR
ncbi:hypothetical protein AB1046_13355 [Promicromonospora sp. Populi]|uniref:hypothetical protein n=1 Tax=Promicromonospora sp. Populi TaxID=3239420 RepID=UPI0034E240DD